MMMINGEEWTVAELSEEMRKWMRDEYEKMKTSYHVMEMMKRRHIEIPKSNEMNWKENDIKHGYIGKQ